MPERRGESPEVDEPDRPTATSNCLIRVIFKTFLSQESLDLRALCNITEPANASHVLLSGHRDSSCLDLITRLGTRRFPSTRLLKFANGKPLRTSTIDLPIRSRVR